MDLYLRGFFTVLGLLFVYASLRSWVATRRFVPGRVEIRSVQNAGANRGSQELAGPHTVWLHGVVTTANGDLYAGTALGEYESASYRGTEGQSFDCFYDPQDPTRWSMGKGFHLWAFVGALVGVALVAFIWLVLG